MSLRIPINDLGRQNAPFATGIHAALLRVAKSGRYVLGPEVEAFEEAFARYCGVDHCIGVANGTDALELALRALEIGPGHDVVTTANAGGYSTAAILATGARPLYVDIDVSSGLLDPTALGAALTEQTRAIIATHLFGYLANMAAINEVATDRCIAVVEDAAQAHGAQRDGYQAGSFGDLACFSFYPTKNLGALGDGGAVVTSDDTLAEKVRSLRQYGWSDRFVTSVPGGRNSRLDAMQAAVLQEKLPHLDAMNVERRDLAARYCLGLADSSLILPDIGVDHVFHLFVIRHPARDALQAYLTKRNVETDIHYPIPDYRQAVSSGTLEGRPTLANTEEFISGILTLPFYIGMGTDTVDTVIQACVESLNELGDRR